MQPHTIGEMFFTPCPTKKSTG